VRQAATYSGPWRLGRRAAIVVLIAGIALWLADASLRPKDPACPWSAALAHRWAAWELNALTWFYDARVHIVERDAAAGQVQVESPWGRFWAPEAGSDTDGRKLVAYLIAEHVWMSRRSAEEQVRPGETVIDCGAHVGTFTRMALNRGARRVLAVEANPANQECLRRNFRAEMASGKVVLLPYAAWDAEMQLTFRLAGGNSGSGSAVLGVGDDTIRVPARPLDAMLAEAGAGKVDYLKMDIEGAERNALRGAMQTLRRDRPRVMLESYHLPDDPAVLPALLRQAWSGYAERCGACRADARDGALKPYVLYFH
jgi:FkbM family methyltransferase